MTDPSSSAEIHRAPWPSAGLVLLAPAGVSPADGARLAGLLGLRSLACTAQGQADPQALMARLAAEVEGWLLPLGLDPGAELAKPGCWSEALGAWRQPVLLQLSAAEAESGLARAYTALLVVAGVPLVGLVQLDGPWQPERRRLDGLPWLGWLSAEMPQAGSLEEEAAEALRLHLLARWQLSSARAAEPADPTP